MSIFAGIVIGIGCTCYCLNYSIIGAILFSVGLLSVIFYGFKLFTGKAGLFATKDIALISLCRIWLGNLIGIFIMCFIVSFAPGYETIVESAQIIMAARAKAGYLGCFFLAIPCGMLMYMAVTAKQDAMKVLYVMLCVMGFIMGGFYHCIADMFYIIMGMDSWKCVLFTIPVTLGNFVGCNLIPWGNKICGKGFLTKTG